ncbi:MAG: hypothetical protein AAFR50_04755 [Pseudomonadota bacterium]
MKTLSRRQVIATLSATTVTLCPAVVNAAIYGWPDGFSDEEPHGQSSLVNVSAGEVVDITALAPGELAVLARPNVAGEFSSTGGTQFVGVLHRTPEQIAAASGGAATQDAIPRRQPRVPSSRGGFGSLRRPGAPVRLHPHFVPPRLAL